MRIFSKKVRNIFSVALFLFIAASVIYVVQADEKYVYGEAGAVFNAMLTEEGEKDLGENQGTTAAGISIEAPVVTAVGLGLGDPEVENIDSKGNIRIGTIYDRPSFIARFGKRGTPVALMSGAIEGTYRDSLDYGTVEYLARDWAPKTQANAAANGAEFLTDIVGRIWSFTRDLSYGLLATVLVVIGIMIMFRQKIGGQMLVTIQNSIPRLLLVILLISISLPIAGLFMDLGGILNDFIARALPVTGIAFGEGALNNPIGLGFSAFIIFVKKTFTTTDLAGVTVSSLFLFGAPALISLVILFLLLTMFIYLAFKVWLMLISQLGRLLLETVLLPINILVGAIPGNESSITNAFKKIAVLVAAFPVSYFLIRLAFFIALESTKVALQNSYGFLNETPKTGMGAEFFSLVTLNGILMYGVLILVPQVPEILNEMFKVESSKAIQGAIQQAGKDRAGVPLIGGLIGGK